MANNLYKIPDTYDWELFRSRLRTLMNSYGYNMSDLARNADLNVTSISRYLQGMYVPDLVATRRIADHFGVSIDWLIGRAPSKFDSLSEDQHYIIDRYSAASPADKNVVKIILSKYDE